MSEEAPSVDSLSFQEDEIPADPFVGRVLNGRFTLLEPIGSGGMGRVYRALQAPLDRVVAVKILDSNYAAGRDPSFQKRFFLEASLTSRLRHPNTITVIDYGRSEDGIFFIAMEYVEGLTLAQLLTREGMLPQARVLHIAQQICRSLREAHRLGLIHRDLKPANVMLLEEETDHDLVKVLDFGLVKSLIPTGRLMGMGNPEGEDLSEITQHGALLGSPLYMAPEHARHLPVDARSDIYSLGVMMYQMLVGKPPFQGQSIDVIVKHVHELPRPLRLARPDLSFTPEVEALVLRCLEKDPARRFASMDELLLALRDAGSSGSLSAPRAAPLADPGHDIVVSDDEDVFTRPSAESAAWRKSPWPWALITLSGLLFVSAAVFLYLQWEFPEPTLTTAAAPASQPPPRPLELLKPTVITRFVVHSNPPGAKVSLEGQELGHTPLETDVAHDDAGIARMVLTLELEGYHSRVMELEGSDPEVVLTATMEPLPGTQTASERPDYKTDPYE